METNTLNIVLGILTLLSIVITFISEKYRLISIAITFIFIIIIIISMQQIKISDIQKEQNKLKEWEELLELYKKHSDGSLPIPLRRPQLEKKTRFFIDNEFLEKDTPQSSRNTECSMSIQCFVDVPEQIPKLVIRPIGTL